ncbi:MAG: formate hydrogenlyase, partial [Rhodoferax sp.]|nr:formate hydrogenlyase [Rhodoferax sp.]
MIKFVPQLVNLLATIILLLSFAMISQRRIVTLINLFMIQGAALVAASFLLGYVTDQPDLYVSGALTLVLKVIFIPWMLHRVIRKLNVRWDVETLFNIPTIMLVGIALVILSFSLSAPVSRLSETLAGGTLGIALACILLSFMMMI